MNPYDFAIQMSRDVEKFFLALTRILVVAEGVRYNGEALARYFRENRERLGFEV
jgi:hypothetical protein